MSSKYWLITIIKAEYSGYSKKLRSIYHQYRKKNNEPSIIDPQSNIIPICITEVLECVNNILTKDELKEKLLGLILYES